MDNLTYVKQRLLAESGIDEAFLAQCLALLSERKIDFGDLFFEHVITESFSLDESIIKTGAFSITSGVGVRAILGEKCGFAYSDVIEKNAILEACKAARSITAGHNCERVGVATQPLLAQELKALYSQENPLESLERAQKIALLREIDEIARSADPRVDQVHSSLSQLHRLMLVVNTDGTISADVKPVVQLNATVVMKDGQNRESGFASQGGAYLLDELVKPNVTKDLALEAVRLATLNLHAEDAPAGQMPVVLGAGWPGVLIHEAVGHGLEGDANFAKNSAYHDKIGQQVASSACTIVDDGTLPLRRGSQSCDDEGTKTNHTVLIENGVLKNYMHDRKSAMLMKCQPTGNGRRDAYDYIPMPRMTNTYMMPGSYKKEEIISTVKKGIYAANFHGGQVNITSGRFVFTTAEAYLIEDGKITRPIKNATLSGTGFETMQKVSMVADDLEFDHGIGVCGKNGQSVMVGIGQPTLKVDELTVGGTAA